MHALIAGLVLLAVLIAPAAALETDALRRSLAGVNTRRIVQADKEPQNWLAHGRT